MTTNIKDGILLVSLTQSEVAAILRADLPGFRVDEAAMKGRELKRKICDAWELGNADGLLKFGSDIAAHVETKPIVYNCGQHGTGFDGKRLKLPGVGYDGKTLEMQREEWAIKFARNSLFKYETILTVANSADSASHAEAIIRTAETSGKSPEQILEDLEPFRKNPFKL